MLRAGAATMVCAVLGALAAAGSAAAHATLIATDPGHGALVATVPTTVSLTFSEPVVVAPDGVRVLGPDGAPVATGQAAHLGRATTVGVSLPRGDQPSAQQQGTYTVAWRVISADSHPVTGAFTFSVGRASMTRVPTAPPAVGSTTVNVIYGIIRFAAFVSFAALVGSIGFVVLCWPGAIARRDVRRIMLAGWAGLLAATMASLLLQGPYGHGLGVDRVLDSAVLAATRDSRFGTALTTRLMLLALTGGYVVLLCAWLPHLARTGRAWLGAIGAGLAAGLAATWAAAGHAATGLQVSVALPVDVVHLVAMGLWLGGLVTLMVVVRWPGADPSAPAARFSSMAAGLVMILIGTGSYQSWRQLGSWGALGSTDYGRLLLGKLGAVALLLGIATLSRRWITRRPSVLYRSVWGEAVLGAVVLGVTTLLVNTEPGRVATAAPPGPAHQVVSYDTGGPGGTGRLTIEVDPAATGPNTVRVTVTDPPGDPRDVAEINATVTLAAQQLGPLPVPLQRIAPGHHVAREVQIPQQGTWQLAVTVRTSDIDRATVTTLIDIR